MSIEFTCRKCGRRHPAMKVRVAGVLDVEWVRVPLRGMCGQDKRQRKNDIKKTTKTAKKAKAVKGASKGKRVTRKFMMDLANKIYDPKTKLFLRLCDGKLQNGPDPTNRNRTMHCGLGELYFAITGVQPNVTGVDENEVVDLAVKLSPLKGEHDATHARVRKAIKALKLPSSFNDALYEALYVVDYSGVRNDDRAEDQTLEGMFRTELMNIPDVNDDGCLDVCDDAAYLRRSQKVAESLRRAAKLLPE